MVGVILAVATGWRGGEGVGGFISSLLLTPLLQLRFFTIMSNTLVAITAFQLAFSRDWTHTWHVLRIAATICITITGVFFALLLAGDPLEGLDALTNFMVHILTPLLAPLAWLVFGPATTTVRRVLLAAVVPVVWLTYTLVQGAITQWYPYPFLEAHVLGYGRVAVTLVVIFVAYFGLGALMWGIDRWRSRDGGRADTAH